MAQQSTAASYKTVNYETRVREEKFPPRALPALPAGRSGREASLPAIACGIRCWQAGGGNFSKREFRNSQYKNIVAREASFLIFVEHREGSQNYF